MSNNPQVKKAIIYLRCSTSYQTEEQGGFSLQMQMKKCQAYALLKDIEVVKVFTDEGISGRDIKKQKALQEALDYLLPDMFFIVYSISRASRDLQQTLKMVQQIKVKRSHFCSATEDINTQSATGNLFFQIVAAFGEFESRQIASRVADGMKVRKEKLTKEGKVLLKSRFGYRIDRSTGEAIPVEEEQVIIQRIKTMRNEPYKDGFHTPYKIIANKLNEDGVKPRSRKLKSGKEQQWTSQSVKNVIIMEKTIAKNQQAISWGRMIPHHNTIIVH